MSSANLINVIGELTIVTGKTFALTTKMAPGIK